VIILDHIRFGIAGLEPTAVRHDDCSSASAQVCEKETQLFAVIAGLDPAIHLSSERPCLTEKTNGPTGQARG